MAQVLVTHMPCPVMCPNCQDVAGVPAQACIVLGPAASRGLLLVCGRLCLCMHGGSVSRSTRRLQHRPAGFACGMKLQQSRLQAA